METIKEKAQPIGMFFILTPKGSVRESIPPYQTIGHWEERILRQQTTIHAEVTHNQQTWIFESGANTLPPPKDKSVVRFMYWSRQKTLRRRIIPNKPRTGKENQGG